MKKFIVLYRAPATAMEQMSKATPEQAKAGMEMWMAWSKRAASAIIDLGAPLGHSSTVGGAAAGGNIAGFSILQGDSIDGVKKVLDGHPHLTMPGASIEVLEYLPMPGM